MPQMQRRAGRSEHAPGSQGEKQTVSQPVDRLLRRLPHRRDEDQRGLGHHAPGAAAMSQEVHAPAPDMRDRMLRPIERRVLRLVDEGVVSVVTAPYAVTAIVRPLRMQVHRDPRDPSEPCWRCDWENRVMVDRETAADHPARSPASAPRLRVVR
jgi:hypothetical protein